MIRPIAIYAATEVWHSLFTLEMEQTILLLFVLRLVFKALTAPLYKFVIRRSNLTTIRLVGEHTNGEDVDSWYRKHLGA